MKKVDVPAYERRLAQGLCQYCGLNPFDAGTKTCASCKKARYATYKDKPYYGPEKNKAYRILVKRLVFEKYGGVCEICGEHRWECLSIDHVNQDGKAERAANRRSTFQFFLVLKKIPRRPDLRVLCMSCNWSIAQWGYSARDPSRPPQPTLEEYTREYQAKWSSRRRYADVV